MYLPCDQLVPRTDQQGLDPARCNWDRRAPSRLLRAPDQLGEHPEATVGGRFLRGVQGAGFDLRRCRRPGNLKDLLVFVEAAFGPVFEQPVEIASLEAASVAVSLRRSQRAAAAVVADLVT